MWRAGCEGTRTPGSGGGSGKRNGRNIVTAPRADLTSAAKPSTRSAAASNRPSTVTAGARTTPLYGIRNVLRCAEERLTDRQRARLDRAMEADERHLEVAVEWQCAQQLRQVFHQSDPAAGRRLAEQVLASFPTCPIPEIARLGRTLKRWRAAFLAYFDTAGANNGGTEAINGLIELHRRIARGLRNRDNYRLRMLLIGGGLDKINIPDPPQV